MYAGAHSGGVVGTVQETGGWFFQDPDLMTSCGVGICVSGMV